MHYYVLYNTKKIDIKKYYLCKLKMYYDELLYIMYMI